MSLEYKVKTPYRTIVSDIPHPETAAFIEELKKIEPRSMSGFSQIVWDRAEGFQIWDAYGNQWIDFTSAVVLTNAGHANPRIGKAIVRQLEAGLWHNYCNPSKIRLETLKTMSGILPEYLDKVFLLCTGSEAVECAIKLIKYHGRTISDKKLHIISYYNSFHGRTMASQRAGGYIDQQSWMGLKPEGFKHIPFPECSRCPWGKAAYKGCGKECLERSLDMLRAEGIFEDMIAGVLTETFQGPTVAFMPLDYVAALREWTETNKVLLVFDEIQAGFGRTGKWFGFEHYGVEPDLVCMGKGMTSSLPMSAVAGRGDIMDIPAFGEMSSTHTGNPLCCAAAIENIRTIRDEGFLDNAAMLENIVLEALNMIKSKHPERILAINGKGLVWSVHLCKPGTRELDVDFGKIVVKRCLDLGLLMLSTGRGTLKIAPPLCISKEALLEGIGVIDSVLDEFYTKQEK